MKLTCPNCYSRFDRPTTLTDAPMLCPVCGHVVPEPEKVSSSNQPAVHTGKPAEIHADSRPGVLKPVQPISAPESSPPPEEEAGRGEEDLEKIGEAQGVSTSGVFPTASSAELKAGDILGGCEIVEKIASGGMGTVYRARHLRLGIEVALKVLPEELASKGGPNVRLRFFNEAQTAAQIDHPNVVKVFDVGQERGSFYIIFQHVRGETLEAMVRRQGPPEYRRALEIIRQAAEGLLAAHKKGLIHRDVKPSNIMIDEEGRVKITDFGLARFEDISCELNTFGHIMGTPYYMSPEQCDGKDMDHRSDIYSLGCTLHYLLTGTHPFVAENTLAIMRMHREAMPQAAHEINLNVPREATLIVERAMAKRPAERYPSLVEFIADVDDMLAGRPPQYASAWKPVAPRPDAGPEPILPLPEQLPARAHASGILGGKRAAFTPAQGTPRKVGGTLLKGLTPHRPAHFSSGVAGVVSGGPAGSGKGADSARFPREASQADVETRDVAVASANSAEAAGIRPATPSGLPPARPSPPAVQAGGNRQTEAEAHPPLGLKPETGAFRAAGSGGMIAASASGQAGEAGGAAPAGNGEQAGEAPGPSPVTPFKRPAGPVTGWGPVGAKTSEPKEASPQEKSPSSVQPRIEPAGQRAPTTRAAGISGYNPWTVERDNYAERVARDRRAMAGKVFDTRCSRCGHVFEAPGSRVHSSMQCPNCGSLVVCEPIRDSKMGGAAGADWKEYGARVVRVCVFLLTAVAILGTAYFVYWLFYGKEEHTIADLENTVGSYYRALAARRYSDMYRIELAGKNGTVDEKRYVEHMRKVYCVTEVRDFAAERPVLSEDGRKASVAVRLQLEGAFAKEMKSSFTTTWIREGRSWLKLPARSLCQALDLPTPSDLPPDSD